MIGIFLGLCLFLIGGAMIVIPIILNVENEPYSYKATTVVLLFWGAVITACSLTYMIAKP